MAQFRLDRCPHCGIAKPLLTSKAALSNPEGGWYLIECSSCYMCVMVRDTAYDPPQYWPEPFVASEALPQRAREFLIQAADSLNSPAGSVILSAGAIDSMLKAKGYKDGTLYSRILKASESHVITPEMAEWAHEVRLDANDQRHADEEAPLPNAADAGKSLAFAQALGEFLFELPARIAASRQAKK